MEYLFAFMNGTLNLFGILTHHPKSRDDHQTATFKWLWAVESALHSLTYGCKVYGRSRIRYGGQPYLTAAGCAGFGATCWRSLQGTRILFYHAGAYAPKERALPVASGWDSFGSALAMHMYLEQYDIDIHSRRTMSIALATYFVALSQKYQFEQVKINKLQFSCWISQYKINGFSARYNVIEHDLIINRIFKTQIEPFKPPTSATCDMSHDFLAPGPVGGFL
jgi:hypothetical protein